MKREYSEICRKLQSYNTTGKQISSVATLLLADRLVGRCLFGNEEELELDQIEVITKPEEEISTANRAYEFALNWVATNRNCFAEKGMEFYGSKLLGELDGDYCFVNSTAFKEALQSGGFSFDSVKKEWAELEYIERDASKKYTHGKTIRGILARYVKLNIVQRDSDGFEPIQEELPFV